MKIRELYSRTVQRLRREGIADPALEAELILRAFLGISRVELFLADGVLGATRLREFETLLLRRLGREPLAYILGEQEFWSLPFFVSPDVLIPRSETELLIGQVLSLVSVPATFAGQILELGVGSGIIATVLALELPNTEVVAVDLSRGALGVAARNIDRHGVGQRISLLNGDWFGPLRPSAKFDFIVANPPYVAGQVRESLQPELFFEPDLALYAGDDGSLSYRRIIPFCRRYLRLGGYVVFEIGADQEQMIHDLFSSAPGLDLVEIVRDYAGLPRVAIAKAVDDVGP